MIVLTHLDGHAVVTQEAHARMCGQLAGAWGNDRFGVVAPAEEVHLAAEQHERGMVGWDLAPELDPATGLPKPVTRMDLSTHLPLRLRGPELLAVQSPYAALVVSLHHTSFYRKPSIAGLVRTRGRQIATYLRRSAKFQAQLRAAIGVSDAEIERNWRLVRTWDGLSHSIMQGRAPRTVRAVPAAAEGSVDVRLAGRDGGYTLDPWPFEAERLVVDTEARLLAETFSDEDRLHRVLSGAPVIELSYELEPA